MVLIVVISNILLSKLLLGKTHVDNRKYIYIYKTLKNRSQLLKGKFEIHGEIYEYRLNLTLKRVKRRN